MSLIHLNPRPKSSEVSVPGAWIYYQLMMILTSVAEKRVIFVKMRAAVATQSLSTAVMTSSVTQMRFRYADYLEPTPPLHRREHVIYL